MIVFSSILVFIVLAVYLFLRTPKFGAVASGERLLRIRRSPQYREGSFQNIHYTPTLSEGASFTKVMWEFFFNKNKRIQPKHPLPNAKTNLHTLAPDTNVLVWFGHSSYYLQIDGKKILVDPVFNGYASPFSFSTKSYPGTDVYSASDFPEIDYLFISHDHWDHLSYPTVQSLKPKIKKIITGLGTGAHVERWGYKEITIEKDWNETVELDPGFSLTLLPARHFSGRGLTRNQSLWVSFALTTPRHKIYLGGDSGYDTHFEEIGKAYGPFDLAILECGQYNRNWHHIHMMPEEMVQAALDLRAAKALPVHWGKFSLAQHAWDEPILRAVAAAEEKNLPLLHPLIGQPIDLDHPATPVRWWEGLD